MDDNLVFICDDDESIADTLALIIESDGRAATVEYNSKLTYERLKIERPRVLLIDLWMPEETGDVIIKKIRADQQLKSIYIICISASIDGLKVAMEAGADRFLPKPFDIEDVIAMVNEGFAK